MERSRALLILNTLSLYWSSGSLLRASLTSASSKIVSSRCKPGGRITVRLTYKTKGSNDRTHLALKHNIRLGNELTEFVEATQVVVPLAEAQHEPACRSCTT